MKLIKYFSLSLLIAAPCIVAMDNYEAELAEAIELSKACEISMQEKIEQENLEKAIKLSMEQSKPAKEEAPKVPNRVKYSIPTPVKDELEQEDDVRAPINPFQGRLVEMGTVESDEEILRRYNDPAVMGLDPELAEARRIDAERREYDAELEAALQLSLQQPVAPVIASEEENPAIQEPAELTPAQLREARLRALTQNK